MIVIILGIIAFAMIILTVVFSVKKKELKEKDNNLNLRSNQLSKELLANKQPVKELGLITLNSKKYIKNLEQEKLKAEIEEIRAATRRNNLVIIFTFVSALASILSTIIVALINKK